MNVGAANFALLVKGQQAEEYLQHAHEYVSGLTIQNILALAEAVMLGRRSAVVAEKAKDVVASFAYDLGEDVEEWLGRFTLRPARPGGPRRLARDLIGLAALAVNGSSKAFALQWRVVFDDAYSPAPCESCGARSTRVLRENGWTRAACDHCVPPMPLIGFNLGAVPAVG
jgi:hypothetical protein